MSKKLFFILAAFLPVLVFAQDLIIKEDGDTVRCKIIKEDPGNVYFTIRTKHREVETYLAKDEILGLKYYEPQRIPVAHPWMLEMNLNPFNEDGILSMDGLQAKYALTERLAFRLGVMLDYQSSGISEEDYENSSGHNPTVTEHSLYYSVRPGIEYRFLSNRWVSPYLGFELSYSAKHAGGEYVEYLPAISVGPEPIEYQMVTIDVDGAWMRTEITESYSGNSYYYYQITSYSTERGYNSYGGRLLIGVDFYPVKSLYLGFELGIAYEMLKNQPVTVHISSPVESHVYPSSSITDIGFYYNNAIRLGVRF